MILTWRDWVGADLTAQDCVRKFPGLFQVFHAGLHLWTLIICSSLDLLFASSFRASSLSSCSAPVASSRLANAMTSKYAASRRIGPIIADSYRTGCAAASQISAFYFFVPHYTRSAVNLRLSQVPVLSGVASCSPTAVASRLIVFACAGGRPFLLVWEETFAYPWLTCCESTGCEIEFRSFHNWIQKVCFRGSTWCLNWFCLLTSPGLSHRFVALNSLWSLFLWF